MSFFALGVNHQTASVELREKVAFNTERLKQQLEQQANHSTLNDLVVVSTCNRTEIYAISESSEEIFDWFVQVNGLDAEQLAHHTYCYADVQAMTHLMRVASGLDSLMLGEPQILGQVKSAFQLAKDSHTVSKDLSKIFEYAFYAAKRVRSETAVGSHAISMGYAVAQLAFQVFDSSKKLTVMIVAAGEMNSLVAKHLADLNIAKIIICNRTRKRAELLAQELAARVEVEIVDFAELSQHLHRADIVSSCTGSLHQVIFYEDVKQALKQRRYQQMLMVDLAVPRDIESKVEELDGVYLYDVDDLQGVIDENLAQRRQAAVEAEFMVNQLATQLVVQQRALQAGSTISNYRTQGEILQKQELELALQRLQQGLNPEQVLQELSHRLTNKLLHSTSVLLRKAATDDNPAMFEWLQEELQDVQLHSRIAKNKLKYK